MVFIQDKNGRNYYFETEEEAKAFILRARLCDHFQKQVLPLIQQRKSADV
jgi:hypothetical protein